MVDPKALKWLSNQKIINLVCTGEEKSIDAIKDIVQNYKEGQVEFALINSVHCLLFDSKKEFGFSKFCKKVAEVDGKWNAYYITFSDETSYSKGIFNICSDENEVIFNTDVTLYKTLCKLDDKNAQDSIYSNGRGEYCEDLITGLCVKNGIYKKETAVNILRMRYGNMSLDYEILCKFSLLKEIDKIQPYLHYNFDDKKVVDSLKKRADDFFKYGVQNCAKARQSEYQKALEVSKDFDDFYTKYVANKGVLKDENDKFISSLYISDFDYSKYPELTETKDDFIVGKSGTARFDRHFKDDDIIVHVVAESAIKNGVLTLPEGINGFVAHFCSYINTCEIKKIILPSTFSGQIRFESRFTFPNLKRIVVKNDNLISVVLQGKNESDDMLLCKFKRELTLPVNLGN